MLHIVVLTYEKGLYDKPWLVLDMDGTLTEETLNLVARLNGIDFSYITTCGMNGEISFEESLVRRMHHLYGIPKSQIEEIISHIKLKPGAEELIAGAKSKGHVVMLLTGGFDLIAHSVAERLGIDCYASNSFIFTEGVLSGYELYVNGNKDIFLKMLRERYSAKRIIYVGDGANDVPALLAADIGIAVPDAKEIAKQAANSVMPLREIVKEL